jgi:hypothetical protein
MHVLERDRLKLEIEYSKLLALVHLAHVKKMGKYQGSSMND